MRPIGKPHDQWCWADRVLAYVQRFNIVPQGTSYQEPTTQMHTLKRATRSGGQWLGDVIPVAQIKAYANLIPRFGQHADPRLTSFNSYEHSCEFVLNKYFDKNTYHAMSL